MSGCFLQIFMEPKVIIAIIGFVALVVLIVVLLCRKYKKADGSVDREAVGKIILILLFWWVLIFVILIKSILKMRWK